MNKISREYYGIYRFSAFFLMIWAAFISFALFLTTKDNEKLFVYAIIASAVVFAYALAMAVITLIEPAVFEKKLQKLPENEREEILGEGFTKIGKRRFYEHFVLYYQGRKIRLVKFSDIKTVEPKGADLILTLNGDKKAKLPAEPEENSAMLAAALKSKDPGISVIINGRVIEKTDIKEETK